MTDLSSLTADQLAEKVRWWGDADDRAALAELVSRLKTAEDALAEALELNDLFHPDGHDAHYKRKQRRLLLAAIRPNPKP